MTREEQRQIAKTFDLLAGVGAVDAARDSVLVAQATRLLLPLVSKPAETEAPSERAIEAVANLMPRYEDVLREIRESPELRMVFAGGFESCRVRAIVELSDAFEAPVPGPTEPERGTPPAPTFKPWNDAVLDAMETIGGSFVQALAHAYLRADQDNRRRILEVWDPIYGDDYRAKARWIARGGKPATEAETLDLPAAEVQS